MSGRTLDPAQLLSLPSTWFSLTFRPVFPCRSISNPSLKSQSVPRRWYFYLRFALFRLVATTYGISFDVSSSPYLDVSVRSGSPLHLFLFFSTVYLEYEPCEFPSFRNHLLTFICSPSRLIAAYQCLFIGSQCQGIRPPFVRLTFQTLSLSRFACIISLILSLANSKIMLPSSLEIVIFLSQKKNF